MAFKASAVVIFLHVKIAHLATWRTIDVNARWLFRGDSLVPFCLRASSRLQVASWRSISTLCFWDGVSLFLVGVATFNLPQFANTSCDSTIKSSTDFIRMAVVRDEARAGCRGGENWKNPVAGCEGVPDEVCSGWVVSDNFSATLLLECEMVVATRHSLW